jgi:hypothetical protein
MAQKRELLERVRAGGDLSELLTPEVDENVDVPIVSNLTSTPPSAVKLHSEPPSGKKKRRRRNGYMFLGAFLFAVLLGGGVGGYLRMRAKDKAAAAQGSQSPALVVHDAGSSAGSDDDNPPPAPPEQEYIVISIDTEPDGVKVIVAGEERGKTPLDVRLKKSNAPVDVQLLEPGFTTTAQLVVPDRDQRLYYQLVKQGKAIVRVKKPPKDRGSGFRRFD